MGWLSICGRVKSCGERAIGCEGRPKKSSDLMWELVSLRFRYMKSLSSENRSCRASAATINPKFRWDTKSPNPIVESADTVPPRAGGKLRFMVVLMCANHK